jgi:ABC-type spermidine/putrescine transport system permease subunit II
LAPIVTVLALLVAPAELGVNRGIATIVVAHAVFVLAVAHRLVLTRLQALPAALISTFVAGDQMTLPLRLWAIMRVGFTPEINAPVTLVLVSIVLAIVTAWRLKPKGEIEED